ncbi:uncharacterized protein si:ch211-106e7.2 [Scomber scombrus]|uniref:uncharacterized protein si:ch211-106e7.2 n=1 Tax=Scomber scombrus TaxID=13677 RepID=UPI002DD82E4F|nr:uncharacterized protein si:ch211-106e7.2 [Scomber scombrus]
MQSLRWVSGPYHQSGQSPQSSQAATQITQDTVRNQQAGTANTVYQFRAANTGVQAPQIAHFIHGNGASNRQTSSGQTSAVSHQPVSSQQLTGGMNNCYLKGLHGNLQNSSPITQSGNPQLIYGCKVAVQNSAQNSFNANTTNIQQDMSGNWKQSFPSIRLQNGNVVSLFQHCSDQGNLYQNVNGVLTPTATLHPPAQAVCNSTSVSASAQNLQTAQNQHHRQNHTQHGPPRTIAPRPYTMALSQSYRNITTNSPSNGQSLHISSTSQNTQQYSTQPNLAPNNGQAATYSINSNSYQSNQYEMKRFSSKTNKLPLNLTADTQQQMPGPQMSPSFTDSQFKSVTASSDGRPLVYTSSTHNGMQFGSRMMESYPTHYNSNTPQSLSLHSGHCSPKTTHSFTPAKQHVVDELHEPKQQPEGISPQKNPTHSSLPNNLEMLEILEMLTSGNPNNSSIHSSPGRTGPRAVAVVQPLAQECYQVAGKHSSSKTNNQECERITTGESRGYLEKLITSPEVANNKSANLLKDDYRFPPQNPNQVRSNKSPIRNSATSNNSAFVTSSDSLGPPPPYPRQPLCADYTGPELAIKTQLNQTVPPAAQQSLTSEVPESQNGGKNRSEMPSDAEGLLCDLSSLPANLWRVKPLMKWLQRIEQTETKSEVPPEVETAEKLLSIYWDGSCKILGNKLREGWYKDLMNEVNEFCAKHLTVETVILAQVKPTFVKQLKSFHVTADNEVYSELPYTSSWLNTNEQLDDIDKEFGFPWSLIHCHLTFDSDSQPDRFETDETINSIPENEVQSRTLSQTKVTPVESDTGKHSTVEMPPTEPASPDKTDCRFSDSSDSFLSFEIHVLPPEEAKKIFEQLQSETPQSTETVYQPEKVTDSPDEDVLTMSIDGPKSDSKRENGAITPLEQICCIERWKQNILGANMTSSSYCQCKMQQSHKDCTEKTPDEEDHKFHSAVVGENQAKGCENIVNQIQKFSWPELCNEVSQTIDLTDSSDNPYSDSVKDTNNISPLSTSSSSSSIIFISDNKDENLSSSEVEILNQMPDPEETYEQGHQKPTKSSPSTGSHSSEKVLSGGSDFATTHLVDDCGQSQLTPTNEAESSVDPDSPLEGISKCRKVSVLAADSEPFVTNVRTVELVLFGSVSQAKGSVGCRKSHESSPQAVSDASDKEPKPPEVLTVSLSPFKRKHSETVPAREYSVKRWIHEKWRKCFSPTKIRHRSKLKTQKYALSEARLKKAERSGPTNTEELPASSETKSRSGNNRHYMSLKKRRSLSYGLKLGEKKTKKHAVTLNSAVHERSKAENESQAVVPLQENLVLKFSVLPNTFSFKDASNGLKEATDNVSDKADLVGADDESLSVPSKRPRGAWYPNLEKQYISLRTSPVKKQYNPLHASPVPKTSSIFNEYQKKYTKKMQPSMDK